MEDEVLFTIDEDKIARLTLNRPDVHNAFNNHMIEKIIEHLKKLQEAPEIRALVISGNGKSFCAGADLAWMERASHFTESENFEDARLLSLMMYFLDTLLIPTITYVHGAVRGGGIGLIACSDIVLADPLATFSFSEVKLGLAPAVISPYVLKAIAPRYARRYFLTGETFDTSPALQMGLIHEMVDLEKKDSALEIILHQILTSNPSAVNQAKKLIQELTHKISENNRLMTIELIAKMRQSEEGQQGIKSFLQKRPPPWVPERFHDD